MAIEIVDPSATHQAKFRQASFKLGSQPCLVLGINFEPFSVYAEHSDAREVSPWQHLFAYRNTSIASSRSFSVSLPAQAITQTRWRRSIQRLSRRSGIFQALQDSPPWGGTQAGRSSCLGKAKYRCDLLAHELLSSSVSQSLCRMHAGLAAVS